MHRHAPPQATPRHMRELTPAHGHVMDTGRGAARRSSQGAILPLPADVVAQIKSSTAITSLTGVVVELFKNALDAGATKLEANIDFGRGGCTVEDNGLGIAPQEFREGGGLGRMYYTSRYNCGDTKFGRNGTFLASLAAMSLLTITSHHHDHRSHNALTLHHCKPIARQTPAPSHYDITWRDHGTQVTVRDLFGNMPVRVKQRTMVLERAEHDRLWEVLKKAVTGLLLGWGGECSVRIRDADKMRNLTLNGPTLASLRSLAHQKPTSEKRIAPELKYILNILAQASYIPREDWTSWVPASASTSTISIKGAISLEPAPSKRAQFLSLGIRPISADSGYNELYDEINRLFSLSSFGTVENTSDIDDDEEKRRKHDKRFKSDGLTNRQLKGPRKGIDKWPMFSLRITLKEPSAASMPEGSLLESESRLQSVVEVLRAMLTQWLTVHHFKLRKQRTVFEKPFGVSTAASIADGEKSPPRGLESFFSRSDSDSGAVRASTPNTTSRKRKRSTPSTAGSTTQSKSGRKTQRQIQPFTEWSRIKSGSVGFYDTLWKSGKISKKNDIHDQENHAPAKAFSPFINEPILPGSLGSLQILKQVSSVAPDKVTIDQLSISTDQNEKESDLDRNNLDEMITWTNPTTKQTFLVNARTGCVLPRIPQRPQTDPTTSSKPTTLADFNKPLRLPERNRPATTDESFTPWLDEVLHDWANPVFKQAELGIPQASINGLIVEATEVGYFKHDCGRADIDKAFKEVSNACSSKLSKDALQHATVIAQVDKKFILVMMKKTSDTSNGTVLVLIDQHAADERVRVESLLSDLCNPTSNSPDHVPFCSNLGHTSRVNFTVLNKAISFSLSPHECRLFRTHAPSFAAWGILYNLIEVPRTHLNFTEDKSQSTLALITLPPTIAERCKSDPKILIDALRSEIWKMAEAPTRVLPKPSSVSTEPVASHPWLQHIGSCPSGLIDLLNSRACRSAIMFNDTLSFSEAEELVRKLSSCAFPFQCAHGRPSMVPLLNLAGQTKAHDHGINNGLENDSTFGSVVGRPEGSHRPQSFVDAFKAWKKKEIVPDSNL